MASRVLTSRLRLASPAIPARTSMLRAGLSTASSGFRVRATCSLSRSPSNAFARSRLHPHRELSPVLRYASTSATVEASLDPHTDPLSPVSESAASDVAEPAPEDKLGFFYLDSVYPLTLGFWDVRCWFVDIESESLLKKLKASIPDETQVGYNFRVVGAEERSKDGGAFLSFLYTPPSSETTDEALKAIEHNLKHSLKHVYAPGLALVARWGQAPSVHVVRGKPWRDDLARFPSHQVKIEFQGGAGAPDEQTLWEVLRPYGRVLNLTIDKKEATANVVFSRIRGATSARNCVHGFVIPGNGAKMLLNFVPKRRFRQAWEWFSGHPRIVLPILAVSLGTLTYAIFDPIRAWFIETKLDETFNLKDYRIYAWLRSNTIGLFESDQKGSGSGGDWWERREAAEEIRGWLLEQPSTFITISGPRGSGKHQLLDKVVTKDMKHLRIDCENIGRTAKGDAALMSALASETGYFPVFSWISSMGNMLDLAAVGLMGSKAGFATPADQQLKQMLSVVTSALNSVNERTKRRKEKEAKRLKRQGGDTSAHDAAVAAAQDAAQAAEAHAADVKAQAEKDAAAKAEKGSERSVMSTVVDLAKGGKDMLNPFSSSDKSEKAAAKGGVVVDAAASPDSASGNKGDELGPEARHAKHKADAAAASGKVQHSPSGASPHASFDVPVIVIDGFHHKGVKSQLLWDVLSEWAAEVTANGVAHVVFVTDNPVAQNKTLSKALPNVPFKSIILADAETERARSYVASKLRDMGRLDLVYGGKIPKEGEEPPKASLSTAASNWVDLLGGRLTDLEQLVQKVSLGESVESAVQDLISREVVQLRKTAFGDDADDAKNLPWTREQAWAIVSQLAAKEELSYYSALHEHFKGDEAALKAMEQAEIISVRHSNGRPSMIRAGRPMLKQAIETLVSDEVFADTQKLLVNSSDISSNDRTVRGIEAELKELADMAGSANAVRGYEAMRERASYLLGKMATAQAKIQKADEENAEIKKRLANVREEQA